MAKLTKKKRIANIEKFLREHPHEAAVAISEAFDESEIMDLYETVEIQYIKAMGQRLRNQASLIEQYEELAAKLTSL